MTQLTFLEEPPKEQITWIGKREAAIERLNVFLPRTGRAYASRRNYDYGPEDRSNISCLSPWIRHRLLLEEEVLSGTLHRYSRSSAEKFLQEVFWRGYFKGWFEQRPSVWNQYKQDLSRLTLDLEKHSDYQSAICGRTGIDCFDTWVKELTKTGYLHNHARMWFASIWVFTLKLPWQLGASFFYTHLLDGDPASNTLSWRWVAGLHTKGKTYLARRSNIEKYTNNRFAPAELAAHAEPLVESIDHPLAPMPQSASILGLQNYGLIITDEDFHPESLPLPASPITICSVKAVPSKLWLEKSQLCVQFANEAFSDTQIRAEDHFEKSISRLDQSEENNLEWSDKVIAWSKDNKISHIVNAWLPVGPTNDAFNAAKPKFDRAGLTLHQVIRPYDLVVWPHATKGFFKLKSKMPDLVSNLSLANAS
ncbi:MAG: FAD-binding domain-containing protein [Pseudomonadota bacterium]